MQNLSVINKQFLEAAKNNQLDELKNLLSQGAEIHANNDEALRWAANSGHLEAVKFLVLPDLGDEATTQGANIHVRDEEALRWAAENGHLKTVKFLITNGANIHAYHDDIFKIAIKNENEPILMLLNAFLTEEKLLVAASESMLLVAASGSMPLAPGSTGMPITATSDDMVAQPPQQISTANMAHTQRLSITKSPRSKI